VRSIPSKINTDCLDLNTVWGEYSDLILRSSILIEDTENALNWHAFLGHSVDMQGFRAAEFSGVDKLSKQAGTFMPLNKRGIGVSELGNLWEIDAIQEHLLTGCSGTAIDTTYQVLKSEGGETGRLLAEALSTFPFRKGHKYVRALLQNSAKLKHYDYSFRNWLMENCKELGVKTFPPEDFRKAVGLAATLEDELCDRLQHAFFMVGPEMAPYMICDWQLWLWKEERTGVFDSFKLDAFHSQFVKQINNLHGISIPIEKRQFVTWWHEFYPEIPPRLINECIWLHIENSPN